LVIGIHRKFRKIRILLLPDLPAYLATVRMRMPSAK